jgi:class 3 adenylate cyclase
VSDESVRQLKAIMFTDIKGFSSMMGKDEELTVRLVREHRDLIRDALAKHRGEERQTIGDAFMVLFDSAVNAVRCAVEIQTRMREANALRDENERVCIRIGIHLGDIIVDENDIYGDGVNIAARVEPQAEPGGICITQQVFHQIEGKLDCRVTHIGHRELKNIRNAPELYNIILEQIGDMASGAADGAAPPGSVPAGRVRIVSSEPEWPPQPWWKHALWWLVALPFPCWLLYESLAKGGMNALGALAAGSKALAIFLTAVVPAGLLAAAYFVSRFWAKGIFNRWLQGRYFLVFPAAGLALFLYHYLALQGRIESAVLPVSSYTEIPPALSSQIKQRLAESISSYANSYMFDGLIVTYLALVVVLGYVFYPRNAGKPIFSPRHWLVLAGGVAVIVVAEIAFADLMFSAGGIRFLLYVAWLLTAIAVLRAAREEGRPFSGGARAMGSGVVLVATYSSIMSIMGFFMVLRALPGLTEAMKPVIWKTAMQEISEGHTCCRILMIVLLASLAFVLRKGLCWNRKDSSTERATSIGAVALTLVVTLLPLLTFPSSTREMQYALLFPVRRMHPAALKPGADASFYVDADPGAIGLYGERIHMDAIGRVYGEKDFTDEVLLGVLAGGKECRELILASLGDPDQGALSPTVCLTAIEAKIACEVQGKRLASPEEWDAAVGGLAPTDSAKGKPAGAPIARLKLGEWTMSMVHGNPVFQVKGADTAEDIPKSLAPAEFSRKVGFRCAYRYER